MSTPDPIPQPPPCQVALPWYKSPSTIGAAVALASSLSVLAPKVAQHLGFTDAVSTEQHVEAYLTMFGVLASAIGSGVALFKRVRLRGRPITFTKAKAAALNNAATQTPVNVGDQKS